MHPRFPAPFVALATTTLLLAATARGMDPPAPPGGFGVIPQLNNPVTWADGYQTKMDLYLPAAPAPPTGWPGVLFVHGGGGHRALPEIVRNAEDLANHGYVVYAYDVRGDGETPALNPGWPSAMVPHEEKLHDSAQSHSTAQALAPGSIDPARLAVTGFSQGGSHSREAAAYSGQPIPCPAAGCTVTSYPTVLAVAPEIHSHDSLATSLPGGTLVNDELIDDLPSGHPLLALLDAGNYPGAEAWLQTQYPVQVLAQLQSSNVPLLAMFAWQDFKHQLNASTDALNTLLPTTPRRLVLSTGGHSTPKNRMERSFHQDLRRRWFDRFLKGIPNNVELETYAEVAVQPDMPDYLDLNSIWEHRAASQWPPGTPPTAVYLRAGRRLATSPPPAPEAGPVINHIVAGGYDLDTYVASGVSLNPPLAFLQMPLVERFFLGAPLPETMELFGRPRVKLFVDDATGIFQLSIELSHVDPAGAEHFITFGTGGNRSGIPGNHVLEFELEDTAHVIPAGHRLQVRITNIADHDPPGYRRIRFAPYFSNTSSRVIMNPLFASQVDLPLRPYQPNLLPRFAEASAAAGVAQPMRLRAGAANAGRPYIVIVGGSGEAPGVTAPALPALPLNVDIWTQLGLSALNGAVLPATAGLLDAAGQASPGLQIPAPLATLIAGTRFTFAGYLLNPAGNLEAFGPVTIQIDP